MMFMNQLNDIPKNQLMQVYQRNFLDKLNCCMETSAKQYGALTRKRVIKSAQSLLLMVLIYCTTAISQRVLAALGGIANIADISDQAWQGRILGCDKWLEYLLNQALRIPTARSCKIPEKFCGKTIELVDGSIVRQEGKKGQTLRIHMCYNMSESRMDEIHLTDNKTAESLGVFTVNQGSIYIADAGFGKGKNLNYIVSNKADAIIRITPSQTALSTDRSGKTKVDMQQKLAEGTNVVDFNCFIHTEKGKYIPVRIVASRLPEDKIQQAIARKKRSAVKKQSKIKPETLIYAEWVILMTSLNEEYTPNELLELYRIRWQIELLFKRIKQFFKVTKLKPASLKHAKTMVLSWLIIWALTERTALNAQSYIIDKNQDLNYYSPFVFETFVAFLIKSLLLVVLTINIDFGNNLEKIRRRLQNHKCTRLNHFASFFF
jgi:hypothetical protein